MPLLRLLPLHLCWFVLIGALSALTTSVLGADWGLLMALLLLLPALAVVPAGYQRLTGRAADLHGLALALSVVTVLGVTRYLPDLPTLIGTPTQSIATPAELDLHPQARSFKLSDAVVRTEHALRWESRLHDERRGGTTILHYTVAPITAADWTPGLAVNAWAVCDGNDASDARCAHWELSNAEAVAAARTLEGQFRRAVEAAAAENGLRVAANARMLVWVPDARAEIARRGWMLGLSVAGVWLLFELIAATLRQVRRLFGA